MRHLVTALAVPALLGLALVGLVPPALAGAPDAPVSAQLVRHTAHAGRFVALTFDDGPAPGYTPRVLALLREYGAPATFCMIGKNATAHPELVRQVVDGGMRLCDHTVTHDEHLRDKPVATMRAEIAGGRDDILAAAGPGARIPWFRAPGGNWSAQLQDTAAGFGMEPLHWSVDPRDWSRPGADRIVSEVQRQLKPGGVVIMHDGGGNREQTVEALARLLPWLVAQGYSFDLPA